MVLCYRSSVKFTICALEVQVILCLVCMCRCSFCFFFNVKTDLEIQIHFGSEYSVTITLSMLVEQATVIKWVLYKASVSLGFPDGEP